VYPIFAVAALLVYRMHTASVRRKRPWDSLEIPKTVKEGVVQTIPFVATAAVSRGAPMELLTVAAAFVVADQAARSVYGSDAASAAAFPLAPLLAFGLVAALR
jgi:hypothetical protein